MVYFVDYTDYDSTPPDLENRYGPYPTIGAARAKVLKPLGGVSHGYWANEDDAVLPGTIEIWHESDEENCSGWMITEG